MAKPRSTPPVTLLEVTLVAIRRLDPVTVQGLEVKQQRIFAVVTAHLVAGVSLQLLPYFCSISTLIPELCILFTVINIAM